MIWSDGLRCMDGKPVREQDGMRDEAARLVSLGVTGAVLVVDGSVPYGEVVAVMDALMTGGIGEFNFSAAKP
jgi:biopolymer transport protein ExbD